MVFYRIEKRTYKEEFPPKGSLFSAGRWNTKGMWVVYTSESIALAKLETLANSGILPKNRILRIIKVRDDSPIIKITSKDLPDNWLKFPYPPGLANKIKAIIAMNKFIGALVPSAQSPMENNLLLFPEVKGFSKYVKEKEVVDEYFDPRLK